MCRASDRKSTRLNSSHTEIYTLSLHDALPISALRSLRPDIVILPGWENPAAWQVLLEAKLRHVPCVRSEEHTSELQSHRDLHSFPTRRSSDLSVEELEARYRDLARLGKPSRLASLA